MKFKNLIFDLDGTLVDSSADIISSLQQAYSLESMNDVAITKFNIGPKLSDLIDNLTPNLDSETKIKIISNYRNIYDNLSEKKTTLYTGVFDTLHTLHQESCNVFIATNKPKTATLAFIDYFNLNRIFADILTPDSIEGEELNKTKMLSVVINKYNLEIENTLMIGDHPDDITAAKNNEIFSAAVLYGYTNKDKMINCSPDYKINSFSELLLL